MDGAAKPDGPGWRLGEFSQRGGTPPHSSWLLESSPSHFLESRGGERELFSGFVPPAPPGRWGRLFRACGCRWTNRSLRSAGSLAPEGPPNAPGRGGGPGLKQSWVEEHRTGGRGEPVPICLPEMQPLGLLWLARSCWVASLLACCKGRDSSRPGGGGAVWRGHRQGQAGPQASSLPSSQPALLPSSARRARVPRGRPGECVGAGGPDGRR